MTAVYPLMVFLQEITEVRKTLWVVFQGKFIPGCLTKKPSGNTLVLKEEKEDGVDGKYIRETIARTGAFIMGKRMFEEGEAVWPNDLYKADVYVLTHEIREPWVQEGSTTFYFINDGIESALGKAKQSAKGKDIRIQGGANTIQQFLNAGLIDEFFIHIAPVFLGSGIRLFEGIDKDKYDLQIAEVIPSNLTTHIRYKLIKK